MLTENHDGPLTSAWVQSSESLKASNSTPAERIYGMLSSVWGLHSVRQEEWKSAKHRKKTFNHSSRSPSRWRAGQRIPSRVMVTHAVQTSLCFPLSFLSLDFPAAASCTERKKSRSETEAGPRSITTHLESFKVLCKPAPDHSLLFDSLCKRSEAFPVRALESREGGVTC